MLVFAFLGVFSCIRYKCMEKIQSRDPLTEHSALRKAADILSSKIGFGWKFLHVRTGLWLTTKKVISQIFLFYFICRMHKTIQIHFENHIVSAWSHGDRLKLVPDWSLFRTTQDSKFSSQFDAQWTLVPIRSSVWDGSRGAPICMLMEVATPSTEWKITNEGTKWKENRARVI